MEWWALKEDGVGFIRLCVFFPPYEIKCMGSYFRMSSGDYTFILSPDKRNAHAVVRKIFMLFLFQN